jgi:hypothetical protein
MKEKCSLYVQEKVEKEEVREKFLAADGLVRLLIARDYKVPASYEMFVKWVDWRLDFKADQIDPNSIRQLLLKETLVLHGYDKANRFCLIVRPRFHTPSE